MAKTDAELREAKELVEWAFNYFDEFSLSDGAFIRQHHLSGYLAVVDWAIGLDRLDVFGEVLQTIKAAHERSRPKDASSQKPDPSGTGS
jgi:hypothetical protein